MDDISENIDKLTIKAIQNELELINNINKEIEVNANINREIKRHNNECVISNIEKEMKAFTEIIQAHIQELNGYNNNIK